MSLALLLRQSILAKQLPLALTLNNLKNVIVYYLVVKYILKTWRHIVAYGPVQTLVNSWRWLSLVCSPCVYTLRPLHVFSLTAGHPPCYASAVHPSKGGSGDGQSTSGYHHKACSPRPKCHSARLSPFPGPVRALDCRRDGENGCGVGEDGPLEARQSLRRCISYVYLTPQRRPILSTLHQMEETIRKRSLWPPSSDIASQTRYTQMSSQVCPVHPYYS